MEIYLPVTHSLTDYPLRELYPVFTLIIMPPKTNKTDKGDWPDRNDWMDSLSTPLSVAECMVDSAKYDLRQKAHDMLAEKLVRNQSICQILCFLINWYFAQGVPLNFRHVAKDQDAYEEADFVLL